MTLRSLLVRVLGLAALAGLAATIAGGLRLPPTGEQGEYARLIAVHPPLAWVAYLAFGVTALASALYLLPATRSRTWDVLAAASAELGVVFTALTLATGSIWGRPTWGVWWVWDARLTLSALMLALLLGYVALRRALVDIDRRSMICAVSALASVAVVPINHFAVSWWRTLHQGRSLARVSPASQLDAAYIRIMLLGLASMTLLYGWLLVHRFRVGRLEEELEVAELSGALDRRRAEATVPAGPPSGDAPTEAALR